MPLLFSFGTLQRLRGRARLALFHSMQDVRGRRQALQNALKSLLKQLAAATKQSAA